MTKKEIESAVTGYHITISDGNLRIPGMYVADVQRNNMIDALKANKSAILSYLAEKQEEEEKARKDREEKIKAIEGLDEIMECRIAWNIWHDAFDRMMETGSSIMTVPKPVMKEGELRDRYPRANAYFNNEEMAEVFAEVDTVILIYFGISYFAKMPYLCGFAAL